jgi:beta-barrel assembly-enhancing protease
VRRARFILATIAAVACISAAPTPVEVDEGYVPQDKDEKGLWMQMAEEERKLKTSEFVIKDPALNSYVRSVFCKMTGEGRCKDVRIYIMRTPYFNATMAPNGMMQIWSGLLLRTRNEAQMAAVLGHEYTHYQKRHSVRLFQDAKKKLATGAWLGMFIPFAQLASVAGIYENSRDMEREADTGSIAMLENAGYDPIAASQVWEQLRAEMDATAAERKRKSRKDKNGGMFATHPPTLERMTELKKLAQATKTYGNGVNNRDQYRKNLGAFWASIIDDQIKLNDFGATEFLLGSLASEGWTSELLYARGELYRARGLPDDFKSAVGFYTQAVADPQVPVEAWRGLGLAKLRSGDATGKEALKTYLKLRPDSPDKAMMAMLAGG